MTTPNTKAGLLESFQRYADLSLYFHRNATPPDLATREFQERLRLQQDIPEMIRRLTAFADLGAQPLLDTAIARANQNQGQSAEWRMLEIGEMIVEGDEFQNINGEWRGTIYVNRPYESFMSPIRRPIPAPVAPEVARDTKKPLRADFEPVPANCVASEVLAAAKDLLEKWENQRKEPGWVKRWLAAKENMQAVIAKHDTGK